MRGRWDVSDDRAFTEVGPDSSTSHVFCCRSGSVLCRVFWCRLLQTRQQLLELAARLVSMVRNCPSVIVPCPCAQRLVCRARCLSCVQPLASLEGADSAVFKRCTVQSPGRSPLLAARPAPVAASCAAAAAAAAAPAFAAPAVAAAAVESMLLGDD